MTRLLPILWFFGFLWFLPGLFLFPLVAADAPQVTRLSDGVQIRFSGKDKPMTWLRFRLISDRVVRVSATMNDALDLQERLIAQPHSDPPPRFRVRTVPGVSVSLSTSQMQVQASLITGEVRFLDDKGVPILSERDGGGKTFQPVTVDGVHAFTLRQEFDSPGREAIYGLGQHQAHRMNYKGAREDLFQYNTKVSVPFVVSTLNYGLLWDNYSLSRFGDPRPFEPLSRLKLFDDQGNPGALTASYYGGDGTLITQRRESGIEYTDLESVKTLPDRVPLARARVTWTGWVEAPEEGLHRFQLYYAGYARVQLGGEWMMEERWRTAWNPSVCTFEKTLCPGERVPVRIEWRPDGGGSYLGLSVLTPIPEEDRQRLSFWSEMGDQIDYYFIRGNSMDEVIAGYRQVTGQAVQLPAWAFGYWQSRERYKSADELLQVVRTFRERSIPLDNIVLDWFYWKEDQWGSHEFDPERFPDPEGMVRSLHDDYHTRIMISVWPKYYVGTEHFEEFDSKGWMYRQAIRDQVRDWVGRGYVGSFYDAYRPEARKLFWSQLSEHLYPKGFDAWWLDATEPDILSNASVAYRKVLMNPTALGPSTQYFNAYALMNARGIYEGQRTLNPDKRVFILTRSGFAGLQNAAAATWSGDIATRWEDMRAQITAGLNFSMSGLPYWTMDIGGFSVEKRFEQALEGSSDMEEWRELNVRWFQFGAFCPLFRAHGQTPFREPFNLFPEGHPGYSAVTDVIRMRYALMPYIYSLSGAVWKNGYTLMRGLAMDYPDDPRVYDLPDQFMFGPFLMVCPVTEYKARNRAVYFPGSVGWYDVYSGQFVPGGDSVQVPAPLDKMPLFARSGAILPMGPEIQYTQEKSADTLTLFVYTGKDGDFVLYEDDGLTYQYEQGAYSTIPIHWNDRRAMLTLGKRQGSFPGMPERRVFRVVRVSPAVPAAFSRHTPVVRQVVYEGRRITLHL